MTTTKPSAMDETPKQIAERLLPCCNGCLDEYHQDDCPIFYQSAVAAFIQSEREQVLDLRKALQGLLNYVEDDNPGAAKADAYVAGLCDVARHALAQKGGDK